MKTLLLLSVLVLAGCNPPEAKPDTTTPPVEPQTPSAIDTRLDREAYIEDCAFSVIAEFPGDNRLANAICSCTFYRAEKMEADKTTPPLDTSIDDYVMEICFEEATKNTPAFYRNWEPK